MLRVCKTCGIEKELELFKKNKYCVHGRSYKCKDCVNQESKVWKSVNIRSSKKTCIKLQFELSWEEYIQLYEKSSGNCCICGIRLSKEKSLIYQTAHIDHNHTTGKIRGILCGKCNSGLGMFRDNPELLKNAHKYLIENSN